MKKKNKIEEKKPEFVYKDFEADFGFLNLILERKKGIAKQFFINVYASQKLDTDPITDEEVEGIISNVITDTITGIGDNYKNFLIEKYFGTVENLIKHISENVYIDLISEAIRSNNIKITAKLRKQSLEVLNKMNNKE